MLLPKRRTKQKIGRILAASVILSFVIFAVYFFFSLSQPLLSPLPKSSKTSPRGEAGQVEDLRTLLTASRIPFKSVAKTKDLSYKIDLENGVWIFIAPKKDLNFQISSLQLILKQLTIEGKETKSIDFRFDKPIIVFK